MVNEALKTDIGTTRDINQDVLGIEINKNGDKLYILCDGMGGYKGGEIAAKECVEYIKTSFIDTSFCDVKEVEKWLYDTIVLANKRINGLAIKNSDLEKMGTTLVCLIVNKNFKVYASVGDSRIYSYSHKELVQLSVDQTFAQALLNAGYISEKEALIHPKKNLLLCAIGSSEDDLDIQINQTNETNYLLCSDGLYNMVNHKEMFKILNTDDELEIKAQNLINLANSNGGKDNISVILVEDCL